MQSFNRITLVGFLGRDPELRYTPQGTAVCNFSVATSDRRKDASGETEERTTWFRVAAWGRQAEICSQYLSKGSPVYIEGRLHIESYTGREGDSRYSVEVNASDVRFLASNSRDRGDEAPAGEERSSTAAPKQESRKSAPKKEEAYDDDIPF